MTKKNEKSSPATNQIKLFDLLQQTAISPQASGLCSAAEFSAAMAEDAKHAIDEDGRELPRGRWDIVARMSAILNKEVTWHMLNNWTSPSHGHLPELQELVAFVMATGGQRRAVSVLFKPACIFPLPGPGALRAEIQHLDEQEKTIKQEKKKHKILLREIERGVRV